MTEEMLAVVDERDNVVGEASHKDVYARGLLHRSASVVVFDGAGRIFVHQRPMHDDLYPGKWDVKFGGSVRAGESYEDAARRELFEEAGVQDASLSFFFRTKFRGGNNNVNRTVYRCVHGGEMRLDPKEVAQGKFMRIADVVRMEGDLSPSGRDVFEKLKELP